MTLVYDVTGRECSGHALPGAVALSRWALDRWQPLLADLGIYVCRPARGSTKLSLHGEGRALDLRPTTRNSDPAVTPVAHWMEQALGPLGIVQEVVWDDHQWSSRNPTWRARVDPATGRPYHDPALGHRNHVHTGLTRWGAATLTRGLLDELVATPLPPIPPLEERTMDVPCYLVGDTRYSNRWLVVGADALAIGPFAAGMLTDAAGPHRLSEIVEQAHDPSLHGLLVKSGLSQGDLVGA